MLVARRHSHGRTLPLNRALTRIYLRKLLLASVILAFANLAHAQQFDFAAGAGVLFSPKNPNASIAFPPPADSGGIYPSISAQYLNEKRVGISVEGAFRYNEALYNGFQHYRPVFYDVNAVYSPKLGRKLVADIMAGAGGETLIFYQGLGPCGAPSGCHAYVNDTHLLLHFGGGVRYYFRHNFFVRPEANYYFIHNNYEFYSDNVLRLGASIGYTWGSR